MTKGPLAAAVLLTALFVAVVPGPGHGRAVESPAASVSASTLSPDGGVAAATAAYLARVPADERARSDAYFEGGYWLQLWSFLAGLAIAWILLATRASAWMRDRARRIGRFRPVANALYGVQYVVATAVLGFPLAWYQGFYREHRYGLSNQTFPEWLLDQGKGLAVGAIAAAILVAALYGVLRRAPRTWWIWGAVVVLAFLAVGLFLAPVYISPLFNEYRPLEDPAVRDPILAMARGNGVPAENVWVFDASKQSKRISANVSGFLGSERVSLNDNLLNRTSLPEIEAVMGHELGHYVLNHVYEMFFQLAVIVLLGFLFVQVTFDRVRRGRSARWGVEGVDDPAGLPLLVALLSVWFFLMTPVVNSIIRVNEAEADQFGLNAARQPEGFAEVALKLGEYRKLDPGKWEEILFFDHPSGRERIAMAMRWKAAQPMPPAPAPPAEPVPDIAPAAETVDEPGAEEAGRADG